MQARHLQQVQLIVDGTKVGFAHQLLIVGLAYRKRPIPITCTWVKHIRGHSTPAVQLDLYAYVRSLLPKGIAALLVSDCEFGAVDVCEAYSSACLTATPTRVHMHNQTIQAIF
jgi:hypothetical protein